MTVGFVYQNSKPVCVMSRPFFSLSILQSSAFKVRPWSLSQSACSRSCVVKILPVGRVSP